jgi:uncharacterized membrane protein
MSVPTLARSLRLSLWLVPLLCLLGGVLLAVVAAAIDRRTGNGLVPQQLLGSPAAVQSALSAIATAMATLVTVVLTVTTVAVQLAMGQFSPRIVAALLHDRRNQLAHGLFLATLAYSVLAIGEVDDQSNRVPGVTVVLAYALMLASIVVLLLYVHRAGQNLRVAGLIDLVGDELHRQLDRRYPRPAQGVGVPAEPGAVLATSPGVLVAVDTDGLVAAARDAGCVLELVPMMGDFVPAGTPLLRVHGDGSRLPRSRVAKMVLLGSERTHADDPAYGFRKLVDIAERSIAQPFDDPTTTVQAVHRLHDCLRQLATRELAADRHHDAAGQLRLVARSIGWDGYVRLAFDEIRLAGVSSPQVVRRLRDALTDLKSIAPPDRQPALDRQLELLTAGVRRSYADAQDVDAGLVPDRQGIGSGEDLRAPGGTVPALTLDGTTEAATRPQHAEDGR